MKEKASSVWVRSKILRVWHEEIRVTQLFTQKERWWHLAHFTWDGETLKSYNDTIHSWSWSWSCSRWPRYFNHKGIVKEDINNISPMRKITIDLHTLLAKEIHFLHIHDVRPKTQNFFTHTWGKKHHWLIIHRHVIPYPKEGKVNITQKLKSSFIDHDLWEANLMSQKEWLGEQSHAIYITNQGSMYVYIQNIHTEYVYWETKQITSCIDINKRQTPQPCVEDNVQCS